MNAKIEDFEIMAPVDAGTKPCIVAGVLEVVELGSLCLCTCSKHH